MTPPRDGGVFAAERIDLSRKRSLGVLCRMFAGREPCVIVRSAGSTVRDWSLLLEPRQARALAVSLLRMADEAERIDGPPPCVPPVPRRTDVRNAGGTR